MLCTKDQTFELRQVQSSNVLYILRPSEVEGDMRSGLAGVAQCHGLLELVPRSLDVLQYLRTTLPLYDASRNDNRQKTGTKSDELLYNAPFSEREIQNGQVELCVFEHGGYCWVPTAETARNVWRSITNSAMIEGISIDGKMDICRVKRLVLEDGCNGAIFDAIIRRISTNGEVDCQTSMSSSKCVSWLGSILLEAMAEPSVSKDFFLSRWQDELPDIWKSEVDFSLLKVIYLHSP